MFDAIYEQEEEFLRAVHGNDYERADELIKSMSNTSISQAMLVCCQNKNQDGFDYLFPFVEINDWFFSQQICKKIASWSKDNLIKFLNKKEYLIDAGIIAHANDECFDYLIDLDIDDDIVVGSFELFLRGGNIKRAKKMIEKTNCIELQKWHDGGGEHHVLGTGIITATENKNNEMIAFILSLDKLNSNHSDLIFAMQRCITLDNREGMEKIIQKVNLEEVYKWMKENEKHIGDKIKGAEYFNYLVGIEKTKKELVRNNNKSNPKRAKTKKI